VCVCVYVGTLQVTILLVVKHFNAICISSYRIEVCVCYRHSSEYVPAL